MSDSIPTFTFVEIIPRPGKGVIVCGTDADLLEWSTERIRGLAGSQVEVRGRDGTLIREPVLEVEVRHALSGRRNVFLLLPESTKPADLSPGARIVFGALP